MLHLTLESRKDDGKGFDTKRLNSTTLNGQGFGLSGIAERVRILSGKLAIKSRPGKGTALSLTLPIPKRRYE